MWWQVKWAKNAAFGLLPFSEQLRRLKRRVRPYPTHIPEEPLGEGLRQIELLREAGCPLSGKVVLEIGTGWRPIIPVLFSLSGAARVVTADTQRLMDAGTCRSTIQNLAHHSARIAARLQVGEAEIRSKLTASPDEPLDAMLKRFRIEYLAPTNVVTAPLPDGGFDVVTSRAVLEHVPPDILRQILGRAYQLLRPGGWTCHVVDNSDHWSHTDRRLSRVNFLRYSDRWFNVLNRFNPLDYQNRLRHPEYAAMLQELGYQILVATADPDPESLAALKSLPLAPRFSRFSPEDLARLDSFFVAQRP